MRETGAESMRQLPTLTLFKINMNLEMEKGTEALASAVEAAPAARARAAALRRARRRRDPRPAGADGGDRAALRRGRRGRLGMDTERASSTTSAAWSSASCCAGSPRSSTTAAPGSRRTGWGSGRCPRRRSWRPAGAWPPSAGSPTATSARPTRTGPTASSPWPTAARRRSATRSSTRSPTECGIGPDGPRHPLLLDRVQEDPPALLHRRLRGLGSGARLSVAAAGCRRSAPELYARALAGPSRRGQLARAGDAPDRPRPDLHRARRGLRADRRRRQPLRRLGLLLGPADPRPRAPGRGRGGPRRRRRGTSYGAATEARSSWPRRSSARFSSVEMLRMTSSGTEAAMSAVRLARAATGREGWSSSPAPTTATPTACSPRAARGWRPWACRRARGDRRAGGGTVVVPWNDREAVAAALDEHEVAALLAEPVPANMGVVPPADGLPRVPARGDRATPAPCSSSTR